MNALWRRLVRWGFDVFYNRFAFTYDTVSAVVSRGEWRAWTRAALPLVRGPRVLEIAFGTGNLHLDLYDAGFQPIGIDLSPYMLAITQAKFRQAGRAAPRLARADVAALPFPDAYFTCLILTFPPGFMADPAVAAELYRVLEPGGGLLWVDAAYLIPRDVWARLLNWAFTATGSAGTQTDVLTLLLAEMAGDPAAPRWEWRTETIESPQSRVHVFVGTKRRQP